MENLESIREREHKRCAWKVLTHNVQGVTKLPPSTILITTIVHSELVRLLRTSNAGILQKLDTGRRPLRKVR
jgi:hypothetical protein